jgi:hypothetical protein
MLRKDHLLSDDENACTYFGTSGFFRNLFTDESGNRLELYCHEREYALLYVSAKGYSRQIGRCPWMGGKNQAYITHTRDRDPPEGVDCIDSVFWRSKESRMFLLGYPYGDRYQIDWQEFTYSPGEDKLVMRHFKSSDGPGGEETDSLVKEKTSYGKSITDDILTFDPNSHMSEIEMWPFKRPFCDVDGDGVCSAKDLHNVRALMGHCENGPNYNTLADIAHDGCITPADLRILK